MNMNILVVEVRKCWESTLQIRSKFTNINQMVIFWGMWKLRLFEHVFDFKIVRCAPCGIIYKSWGACGIIGSSDVPWQFISESNETFRPPLTTKMADEIPLIPKAGTLFINSGNIVHWNRLKRKPTQNPTQEVCTATSCTDRLCCYFV